MPSVQDNFCLPGKLWSGMKPVLHWNQEGLDFTLSAWRFCGMTTLLLRRTANWQGKDCIGSTCLCCLHEYFMLLNVTVLGMSSQEEQKSKSSLVYKTFLGQVQSYSSMANPRSLASPNHAIKGGSWLHRSQLRLFLIQCMHGSPWRGVNQSALV